MHKTPQAKKLVLVLAISTSVTGTKEAPKVRVMDRISCIHYPVQFRNNKGRDVLAFLNSRREVNAITPAYVAQLGLKVQKTDVGAQKIDGSSLVTYGMVIATFQVFDKLSRSWFFQGTFLLTDISMEVVLGILFVTVNNANV